ncbi:MAG: hypothetical protein ACWGIK_02600 [Achromobacter pulmonis]
MIEADIPLACDLNQVIKQWIFMYSKTSEFDKNNKERIYNLLVLKGEALLKGHFLSTHQDIKAGEFYSNFFTTISDQVDPLLIYFINDEISASLLERGPLRDLIEEVKNENYRDEHFKRLQYAESDLQDLFSKRTDFIISSNLLDFKVNTFSAFEKSIDELYEKLLLSNPRSDKKEKKLIELIRKYSESDNKEEKTSLLNSIKKISFYVSGSEKIEYVLSKSGMQNNEADDARTFLKFYRNQRNTIHNLGIHKGENQSVDVNHIEITLKSGGPSYTANYNSEIFACHKLMDIYESMHRGITGERVF